MGVGSLDESVRQDGWGWIVIELRRWYLLVGGFLYILIRVDATFRNETKQYLLRAPLQPVYQRL